MRRKRARPRPPRDAASDRYPRDVVVAAEEGSEPIATGTILAGFHARGHAVLRRRDDPGVPREPRSHDEGVPDRPEDHLPGRHREDRLHAGGRRRPGSAGSAPQKGVWTIVSGSGEYEGLGGSGKSEAVYGPNPSSPVPSTFTGPSRDKDTVTVPAADGRRCPSRCSSAQRAATWASVRECPLSWNLPAKPGGRFGLARETTRRSS